MNNSLIKKLLRAGVIAALLFGAAVAQAEPFIDYGVSTGYFVRGCDINAVNRLPILTHHNTGIQSLTRRIGADNGSNLNADLQLRAL